MSDIGKTGQPKATGAIRQTQSFKIDEKTIHEFIQFRDTLFRKCQNLCFAWVAREPFVCLAKDIRDTDSKAGKKFFKLIQKSLSLELKKTKNPLVQYLRERFADNPELIKYFIYEIMFDITFTRTTEYVILSKEKAKDFLSLTTCNKDEYTKVLPLYHKLVKEYHKKSANAYKEAIVTRRAKRFKGMAPAIAKTLDEAAQDARKKEDIERIIAASSPEEEQVEVARKFGECLAEFDELVSKDVKLRKHIEKECPTIADCVKKIKAHSRKEAAAKIRKARAARQTKPDKTTLARSADKTATKEKLDGEGKKFYRTEGERGPKTRWYNKFFKLPKW